MIIPPALALKLIPPPPASVRDAFALAQYRALVGQVPVAYLAAIPMLVSGMMLPATGVPMWANLGIPVAVGVAAFVRLLVWIGRKNEAVDPRHAERVVFGTALLSMVLAGLYGLWASYNWLHAAPAFAPYYALLLMIGLLTPVLALAQCPRAVMMTLFSGLTPMVLAMIIWGERYARIAAILPIIMAVFLVNMLCQQRRRFIDLLVLEAQMREEAKTDPLTGLVNSRALADRFAILVDEARARGDSEAHPALLRIDLNGLKPVNDMLGHAAGDDVLRQVADRLRGAVGKGALVSRIGGDDFALLAAVSGGHAIENMRNAVLAAFDEPFRAGDQTIALAANITHALWPQDGRTLAELNDTADRRLIVIKQRRNLDATFASAASARNTAPRKRLQAVRNA